MSIPAHLDELNARLGNLERCAETAPEGMYSRAREAVDTVHEASNALRRALMERGFVALNDDHLRAVEATIYGYVLQGNADEHELIVGEGFGAAMEGPAADRVLAQAERDRDAAESARSQFRR
jgi:hypothetical protein